MLDEKSWLVRLGSAKLELVRDEMKFSVRFAGEIRLELKELGGKTWE